MGITIEKVQSFLSEADIEGLIDFGAPDDEYDSEAQIISEALSLLSKEEGSVENIVIIVTEIWKKSFNLTESDVSLRQSEIGDLARRISQEFIA